MMKVISVLLFVLILVKMNTATKIYYQQTNNWTLKEHILLEKQLKATNNNINHIAENLNRTIEDIYEQLKEYTYIGYIKMITINLMENTGLTEKQTFDIINEKNPLKSEINELKNDINELKNEIKELKMIIKNLFKQKPEGETWF